MDSAAQTDEQDFSIPGQDDSESQPGPSSAPAAAIAPSTANPSASAGPSASSGVQVDTAEKIHPHVAILAGLAKQFISAIQNAPGNPNNAFDRGFQNASPQNQQLQKATIDKAMSEADQAKIQTSITGMKALQLEYLLKRLPQEDQQEHLKSISDFKQNLIKEGANVEAEGDDEKASDAQAMHMNGTDPRALNHSGKFYSLPTMDSSGKAKFDVVYVPSKDTLQNDYKWTDPDGNEQTIPAGTAMSGALGKFVEAQQKGAQNQTKEQHKELGELLKPAASPEVVDQNLSRLESMQKQNTPLYQQNKPRVDDQIAALKTAQQGATNRSSDKSAEVDARKDRNTFGYAMDKDGQLAYMSRSQANDLHSTFEQMSPADVNKDRATLRQLNDVQMNVSKYRSATEAMTENVEHTDAIHRIIAGVSQEDMAKAAFVTLGAAMSMMEQSEVKDSWNKLSDKERKLMVGYLRAKGGIVAYNRALTGSGRANKEALMIEMANLPTPDVGSKVAIPQLDSFQENIDQAATGLPTNLPGMKTPKQVRTEVWRDQE